MDGHFSDEDQISKRDRADARLRQGMLRDHREAVLAGYPDTLTARTRLAQPSTDELYRPRGMFVLR